MDKIYHIYKITNLVNNKSYIGFTGNLVRRIQAHKATARNGKGQAIHTAIRKYEWLNFSVETIYCSKDKDHTLEIEKKFIIIHQTLGENGYNVMSGGQGGPPLGFKIGPMSEETKKKISLSKSNPSDETRKKLSESAKNRWKNPDYREKVALTNSLAETKERRSIAGKQALEDPNQYAAMLERVRKFRSNPEFLEKVRINATNLSDSNRKKKSEATKNLWNNQQWREEMVTKRKQTQKEKWQDPEYRQMMSAKIKAGKSK